MADEAKVIFKFEDDSSSDSGGEGSPRPQGSEPNQSKPTPDSPNSSQRSIKEIATQATKGIGDALSKGQFSRIPAILKEGLQNAAKAATIAATDQPRKAIEKPFASPRLPNVNQSHERNPQQQKSTWQEAMDRLVKLSTPKVAPAIAKIVPKATGVKVVENATAAMKAAAPTGKAVSELATALPVITQGAEAAGAGLAEAGAAGAAGAGALTAIAAPALAVVAVLGAVGYALSAVDDHLKQMQKDLARFSPALQLATSRNRVAKVFQDMERAERFGEQLAKKEDAEGRFDRALTNLKDQLSTPFTGLLTDLKNGTAEMIDLLTGIDSSADSIDKKTKDSPFVQEDKLRKLFDAQPLFDFSRKEGAAAIGIHAGRQVGKLGLGNELNPAGLVMP